MMTTDLRTWIYTKTYMNKTVEKYWKNWLILLLAVMNISTLATIFYNNRCCKAEETVIAGNPDKPLNGQCFLKEMEFTPEQTVSFRKINCRFRQKICHILPQLQEQKNQMFQELQQVPADTLQLEGIAKEIGRLHYQLKKETARFYLAVQHICNSRQQQKLEQYFTPLFDTEGCPRTKNCPEGKCKPQKNFKP